MLSECTEIHIISHLFCCDCDCARICGLCSLQALDMAATEHLVKETHTIWGMDRMRWVIIWLRYSGDLDLWSIKWCALDGVESRLLLKPPHVLSELCFCEATCALSTDGMSLRLYTPTACFFRLFIACNLHTVGILKCLGLNSKGDLGIGSTANIGDASSEVGDGIVATDLGENFDIIWIGAQRRGHCGMIYSVCWQGV